jgi:hypothetical protein
LKEGVLTISPDYSDRDPRLFGALALKRLVGFSAKNRFYRANRDLGRIFKTEFILQYPLGAGAPPPHPARLAQGRATPLLGQGRLLRAARPDQRARALGADEHLQLPEPDPGVHRYWQAFICSWTDWVAVSVIS